MRGPLASENLMKSPLMDPLIPMIAPLGGVWPAQHTHPSRRSSPRPDGAAVTGGKAATGQRVIYPHISHTYPTMIPVLYSRLTITLWIGGMGGPKSPDR